VSNRLGVGVPKNMLWSMKLLDMVVWIWFLFILSEQNIKFVRWFGCRFVRILKDQWKW
jgi:hypothetical protein